MSLFVLFIAAAIQAQTAQNQIPPPSTLTNDVVLPARAGLPPTPMNDVIVPPAARALTTLPSCGTALTCPTPFSGLQAFIPTPITPTMQVDMNWVIIQKSDGSGNWKNTPQDVYALSTTLMQWINAYLHMYGCVPSDPCPGVGYPTDTNVQMVLKNIWFIPDTTLYTSTNTNALLTAVVAAHPAARDQLNIFWNGASYGGASAFALTPSTDRSYDQAIVMVGNTDSLGDGSYLQWPMAGLLVHEIGHVFNLLHTYTGGCCPETYTPGSCENLDDVFCPPTNPYPQTTGWGCDPWDPANTCTNNIMGGTKENCLFTADQLGRVNQSLQTFSTNKYVEPTACLQPPPSRQLWLPLDEPMGATAVNPYGLSGGRIGNPARTPGKANLAMQLNGAQHVDVPSYAAINFGTNDFTLEAWVQPSSVTSVPQVIAEKRDLQSGVYHGYSMFLYNGLLCLQLADASGYTNFCSSTAVPVNGQFHLVHATVQRHSSNGGVFYIDGTPSSTFDPRQRHLTLNNNAVFRVGCDTVSGSSCLQGAVDEVVAYNRALSGGEIHAIFAAQGVGICKQYCTAPITRFALSQASVSVNGQICNATAVPRTFMYWYEGTPAGTCSANAPVDGPPTFTPCSATITVPAGSCVAVPAQVPRPPGFTNAGNNICYRLAVQSLGNNDVATFRCASTLADYDPNP